MKTYSYCVALLLVLLACTCGYVVGVQTDVEAMTYLSQFGYLNPSIKSSKVSRMVSKKKMVRGLRQFQSFVGLDMTGRLDDDTQQYMNKPRCGFQDKVWTAPYSQSRPKRYLLQVKGWEKNELTYRIFKYSKHLGKSETDFEIQKAFNVWAKVTPLKFIPKKSGEVDIEIRFLKGNHGDDGPFDGLNGLLAHAFYPGPGIGGDVHFDDSEKWSIDSKDGTNLFQVAAHEFGHSLGLGHSEDKSALMAPVYRDYDPDFTLPKDDLAAIQKLYGSENSTEQTFDENDYDDGTSLKELDEDTTVQESNEDTTVQVSDEHITVQASDEDTTMQESDEDTATVQESDEVTTVQVSDEYTTVQESDEDTTMQESDEDTATVQESDEDTTVQESDEDTATVQESDEDTTVQESDEDTATVQESDEDTAVEESDEEIMVQGLPKNADNDIEILSFF